eukprot:tig00001154_g7304.t1
MFCTGASKENRPDPYLNELRRVVQSAEARRRQQAAAEMDELGARELQRSRRDPPRVYSSPSKNRPAPAPLIGSQADVGRLNIEAFLSRVLAASSAGRAAQTAQSPAAGPRQSEPQQQPQGHASRPRPIQSPEFSAGGLTETEVSLLKATAPELSPIHPVRLPFTSQAINSGSAAAGAVAVAAAAAAAAAAVANPLSDALPAPTPARTMDTEIALLRQILASQTPRQAPAPPQSSLSHAPESSPIAQRQTTPPRRPPPATPPTASPAASLPPPYPSATPHLRERPRTGEVPGEVARAGGAAPLATPGPSGAELEALRERTRLAETGRDSLQRALRVLQQDRDSLRRERDEAIEGRRAAEAASEQARRQAAERDGELAALREALAATHADLRRAGEAREAGEREARGREAQLDELRAQLQARPAGAPPRRLADAPRRRRARRWRRRRRRERPQRCRPGLRGPPSPAPPGVAQRKAREHEEAAREREGARGAPGRGSRGVTGAQRRGGGRRRGRGGGGEAAGELRKRRAQIEELTAAQEEVPPRQRRPACRPGSLRGAAGGGVRGGTGAAAERRRGDGAALREREAAEALAAARARELSSLRSQLAACAAEIAALAKLVASGIRHLDASVLLSDASMLLLRSESGRPSERGLDPRRAPHHDGDDVSPRARRTVLATPEAQPPPEMQEIQRDLSSIREDIRTVYASKLGEDCNVQ